MSRRIFWFVAVALLLPAAAVAQNHWTQDSSRSAMDDRVTFMSVLKADSITGYKMDVAADPLLSLSCIPRQGLRIFVLTDQILVGAGGRLRLLTRLDQQDPEAETWSLADNFRGISTTSGALQRVRALASGHTYLIQVPIFNQGVAVIYFDVTELGAQVDWLVKQCGIEW